jgi:fatty-acyl-CoA synthase
VESPLYNVGGWLARRARIAGDRLAVVDAHRSLSYLSLDERSARCAAALSEAGLGRGDRVALLLGNRSAYLEVVFAAARLGAIVVPVNARFTAPEIRHVLEDCTPRLLIHDAPLADTAELACSRSPSPPTRLACGGEPDAYEQSLARCEPLAQIAAVTPDHPMILMYTSGTTGTPKGALLPHRKTLFNSLNAQLFFDLTRDERVLVALPLFHSFGLSILSIPTLYAGGSVFLEPHFDPAAVWNAVDERGITFFGGVPTQFRALLDVLECAPAGRYDLGSLRFLFTAGAAVPVETVRGFQAQGLVLKQGFGQTETSILCCLDARDAVRKAGSVGRPVFHADVRVVAPDGFEQPPERWRDVAVGETGEIVVRGPITMLGYWNDPASTAQTLRGDWLRTGDLATIDDEGFLTLVGRARQMYISGGENVYPAEVEAVFAEHPAIREIAVVGVSDPKWGEVGRAYVVLNPGQDLDSEALRDWGSERLARFKLPADFVALPALPRTESGKVQKHRLAGASAG